MCNDIVKKYMNELKNRFQPRIQKSPFRRGGGILPKWMPSVRGRSSFLILLIIIFISPNQTNAQISDNLRFGGYIQLSPVYLTADIPAPFPDSFWEYRLQNRLQLSWFATDNLTFNAETRLRVFAGDLVKEIPGYASVIDQDDGYMNLSWMMVEDENFLIHLIPDRLFAEWAQNDWNIRIGRQRINWGINMVTNPNDLFNIYSIYDFDYPERPGSDAIRVQRFMGFASKMEVALSPAKDIENMVAAGLYQFNQRGYDIQLISGYYRNRFAIGGGWAGSISETGFKGELMFFRDIEESNSDRNSNFIAAISADHMFDNSLFLITEILYNQQGGLDTFDIFGASLSVDNPSISGYQLTTQLAYPVNPLLDVSLAGIWYPDEQAIFLSPSFTYSVLPDLDFRALTQQFFGADDSIFANAGSIYSFSLTWNF